MPNLSRFFRIVPTAASCANNTSSLREYSKGLVIFDLLLTVDAFKNENYKWAFFYGVTGLLVAANIYALETLAQECAEGPPLRIG